MDFFGASMEARGEQAMTGSVHVLIRVSEEIAGRGGRIGILLSGVVFKAAVTARAVSVQRDENGVMMEAFDGGGATYVLNAAAFTLPREVVFDVVVLHAAAPEAQKALVRARLVEPRVTWTVG